MSLNLYLDAGTAPGGNLPATQQALLDFIAQYIGIAGDSNFTGMNFGPDTPSADDRGMPWFKTDQNYNPIGLYSWNGLAWTAIPSVVSSGPTASRPLNPVVGTKYFDTTIQVELIYAANGWTTSAGSPGDVKFVKAATIADALTKNPGWIQEPDSQGRVIGSAGSGSGLTPRSYGATIGEETHTIAVSELPAHSHDFPDGYDRYSGQFQNGPQPSGVYPVVSGQSTTTSTQSSGSGQAMNVMQPTIFYWSLVKQ